MKPKFKPKFHHIGIVVKNMEQTLELFAKLFELEKPTSIISWEDGRYAMIPTDGPDNPMIEPLEPNKGWLLDLLNTSGEMAVAEICFRVADIEEFYDRVKVMGFTPVDDTGAPLTDRKFVVIEDQPGVVAKFFYFNVPNAGVSFEILEVSSEAFV